MRSKISTMMSLALISVLLLGVLAGCGSNPASGSSQKSSAQSGGSSSSKSSADSSSKSSGNSAKKIVLHFSWWGSQDRHNRTLKVIKLYEQENPNVTIKPEYGGWKGYWDKRATQAAGGDLPDIIQMDKKYLSEYVTRHLLYNLNNYVQSKTLDLSDVDKAYISGGYIDGKLYAVNIGANALTQAVDPAMYKKAGVPIPKPGYTWEQYVQDAYKLKKNLGKNVYVRGFNSFSEFQYYVRGHGQTMYNKDGTALGFDKKLLVDYFTMWNKMYKDKVLPSPSMTANLHLENEMIVHKTAPNQAFWSNQIVALQKAAGRPLQLTMIPIVKGEGDHKSYYIKPGQFLSVSATTKYPEAAAKFISFFTNSLKANDILAAERGIPISAKVRKHLYPNLSPAAKEMFDFMDTIMKYAGAVPPSPPGEGAIDNDYTRIAQGLGFGKLTPEAAAKQFMDEANQTLAKNKK